MGRRVDFEAPAGNRLPTFDAPAIFVFRQSNQGHFNSGQIAGSTPRFGLGHLLLLHRVHPRQAPNALLIQFNRIPPAGSFGIACLQFGLPIKQQLFQADDLSRGKCFGQD